MRDLLLQALRHSEADETELVFSLGEQALTRFSHNVIHQNVTEFDATLEVRAAFGARVGMASTNDLSAQGIERAVRTAGDLARHLPENPDWPGLPEPAPTAAAAVLAFDQAVADLCGAPRVRAHAVADLCAAARSAGLAAAGAYSTEQSEHAVLNSRGLFAYAPETQAELTFVVENAETDASAYGHATGWQLSQIDLLGLREATIARAQTRQRPRAVPAGTYPVVLEPYAVLTLLEAMAQEGMGALAVQEGRSWMNHRFGTQALSPRLTIVDDALDPRGFPQAFDCEGVPKQRVPIVVAGVPLSPVYDRLTAAREAGKQSTGHAQPFDDEDWDGPLPENLALLPGDMSVPDMIRTVERGLYVSRFWYVRLTAPHDADATGTTRDGVWWIEGGELAYPVTNMRFDQPLLPALQHVRGVGQEQFTLSGLYGIHRLPAVALDHFRFIDLGEDDAWAHGAG